MRSIRLAACSARTFSAHPRHDAHAAARLFKLYLAVIAVGLAMVVVLLRMTAEPLFASILGAGGMSAVPLFKIFVIYMAIGALTAVLVAYLRAVGDVKATTQASVIPLARPRRFGVRRGCPLRRYKG